MNHKEIGSKMKAVRLRKHLTLQNIADDISVAKSTIQRYEAGSIDNLKLPVVEAIARRLGVNPAWLLGKSDKEQAETFSNLIPMETRRIPILHSVSGGEPQYGGECLEGYVEMGGDSPADFAIRAGGDSMMGVRIHDGDIVFIHRQSALQNGEIAAVAIGGEVVLRRFRRFGDVVVLSAENPAFEDIVIDGDSSGDIHILGRAVAFQSGLK